LLFLVRNGLFFLITSSFREKGKGKREKGKGKREKGKGKREKPECSDTHALN